MITVYGIVENSNYIGFSFTEDILSDIQMYAGTTLSINEIATTEDKGTCYNLVDYFTYLKDGGSYKSLNEFANQEISEYLLSNEGIRYLDSKTPK